MSLAAGVGLLMGFVHVFAGPDHLAALGVLTAPAGRRGVWLGLRWGLGHSAGLVAVGVLALLLRRGFDFDPAAGWGEPLVGLALIVVGLRAFLGERASSQGHPHDARAGGAALLFGVLHGLAGASHVWATLPALALPDAAQATAYLLAFCAGSILAMLAFTLVLAWFSGRTSEEGGTRRRWVLSAAAVSVVVGFGWLVLPFTGSGLP